MRNEHIGIHGPAGTRPLEARTPPLDPTSAGFSLVEVMIALVILVFGLVSLAQASVLMVNQVNVSDVRTERVVARYTAVEQLRALPFNNVTGGTTTVGDFSMSWRVTGSTPNSRLIEMVTSGPGTRAGTNPPVVTTGVVDTISFRIIRP